VVSPVRFWPLPLPNRLSGEFPTVAGSQQARGGRHLIGLAVPNATQSGHYQSLLSPRFREARSAPLGHWMAFGEVFTIADIRKYALKTDEPGSKTDRMRKAALETVGATSASEEQLAWRVAARRGRLDEEGVVATSAPLPPETGVAGKAVPVQPPVISAQRRRGGHGKKALVRAM
jgi:hypothetical protein